MKAIHFALLAATFWQSSFVVAQSTDIEAAPISYSETVDDNAVSRLVTKLKSGEVKLKYERGRGYLRSLLKELDISVESQVLVFSKTSMQVQHISRRNPRAVYFNDDVYVAWIRGSSLMEISTSDPKLGAAFYTFEMAPGDIELHRANYDCLACHLSTLSQGVPGHTVRSVFPRTDGTIDVQTRSFVTDHKSPFAERWGGWYVTGLHGDMKHMGNAVLRGNQLDTERSANRLNLRDEFDIEDWLSPQSDIVALMVLEHQTQTHNVFTRASFAVRRALHQQSLLDEPSEDSLKELELTIAQLAKEVVDAILFCGEAKLDDEVSGSVLFTGEFTTRGPKDKQGRSLREFDLQTRLMKYPCSYLVYSSGFDALPNELRREVISHLCNVLDGRDASPEYDHLDAETSIAIKEILSDTKPEFATHLREIAEER